MSYNSILPPNASQLELDLEQIHASSLDLEVERLLTLWRADQIPLELLPWLAWGFSVDVWNPDWPEANKRNVVAGSIGIHRKKGTPYAVKTMLELVGFPTVEIVEWWQNDPAGFFTNQAAHTFCLRVLNGGGNYTLLNDESYAEIQRVVDITKPERSHYCFQVGGAFAQKFGVALGLRVTQLGRWAAPTARRNTANLSVGLAQTWGFDVFRVGEI